MITYEIDKKKWNRLLKKNKSSVFQTYEWAKSQESESWKPIYVVNDDYSGGIVLMQRSDKRAYDSMIRGGYGGYIGKPVDFKGLLTPSLNYIRFIDYANKMKLDGYEKTMATTYLVNLKDFKPSHGIKDNLRVAKKEGVAIERTDDIELFHKIYKEIYEEFDLMDIPEVSYFRNIAREMGEAAKFYVMKIKNKTIGVALQLFYKDEIFNLYNACLEKYKRSGAITACMYKVIEENPGYKVYNLGAATDEGAHIFKSRWGAKRYDYPIYGKIINIDYKRID